MERIETGAKCVVCNGQIVEKYVMQFNARTGPLIIGPGSIRQHNRVSQGFHCRGCGLKYEFLPSSASETTSASAPETENTDILRIGED